MKNYEWINKMAKIDLLYMIESNWSEGRCIINQLNNNDENCPEEFKAVWEKNEIDEAVQLQPPKCYECICKWLNQEHKGV